ncbi:MAG: hypothetical protein V1723_00740 [Candidatus Uhrbacteria bacterium]
MSQRSRRDHPRFPPEVPPPESPNVHAIMTRWQQVGGPHAEHYYPEYEVAVDARGGQRYTGRQRYATANGHIVPAS